MSEIRLGPIERVFVAVNHIFGAFSLIGGVSLLVMFALALIRGGSFADAWISGALGLGLALAVITYLRSPLTRWHKK